MIKHAKEAQKEFKDSKEVTKPGVGEHNYRNLFHALLLSGMPQEEKRAERLAHEGFEVLLAGSDTTARAMGHAVFHILANKDKEIKLREELALAMPDPH